MTLILQTPPASGGRPVTALSAFSPQFSRLVALVPSGINWLQWAITTATPTFQFSDERALLSGLAQGLHGSAVLSLSAPELELDISVLLAFADPEFSDIVSSLETRQLPPAVRAALAQAEIFVADDFATAQEPLLNTGRLALYSGASLAARCEWLTALRHTEITSPESAQAAAAFASTVSVSLSAFTAAWQYHLAVAPDLPEPSFATTLWQALIPSAFAHLSCPVVEPGTPDNALLELLTASVQKTGVIGFATASHAVANFARFAGLDRTSLPDDATAADAIRAYLARLPEIVGGSARIHHLQDGATRWIAFSGPAGHARFQHDGNGHLTLLELASA
jgi:hypothetical protein